MNIDVIDVIDQIDKQRNAPVPMPPEGLDRRGAVSKQDWYSMSCRNS